MQELVLTANSSYISTDEVTKLLANKKYRDPLIHPDTIDLNRSLSEIEHDIVKMVYESENMNQSNTAKRSVSAARLFGSC